MDLESPSIEKKALLLIPQIFAVHMTNPFFLVISSRNWFVAIQQHILGT